jgi:hypothetical protein
MFLLENLISMIVDGIKLNLELKIVISAVQLEEYAVTIFLKDDPEGSF